MPHRPPQGLLIATGIFEPEAGGPASYARALATKLALSMPVTVLTYSTVTTSPKDADLPFRVVRVSKHLPKGIRHLHYTAWALRLAADQEVVLALNPVTAGLPALLAAKAFGRRFVVKVVGDYAWEQALNRGDTTQLLDDFQKARLSGRLRLLRMAQSQVCQRADRVIVPSSYLSRIVAGWGVAPDRLAVVYNGTGFAPSTLSREAARAKLQLSGTVLLSVGRLVPWKGFRTLIRTISRLQACEPNLTLVIIGDGPDRAALEETIRTTKTDKCVTLVGRKTQAELADYLAACDLFVLNTGYEGFSHQILEVMRAGAPLVTTPAGGNPEVVEDGVNGLLACYDDEDALVDACRQLVEDPGLRVRLADAARRTVARFSTGRMIDETEAVLFQPN